MRQIHILLKIRLLLLQMTNHIPNYYLLHLHDKISQGIYFLGFLNFHLLLPLHIHWLTFCFF